MPHFDENFIESLKRRFPDLELQFDVPWRDITTLGVGWRVRLVVEPLDDLHLSEFLKFCHKDKIKLLVVGAGSDLVGSGGEFPGIVLRLRHNDFIRIKISHTHVTAGAGVSLYDLIVACAHNDLGGAEHLAGIPGTVGGALRLNAGRGGVSLGDFVDDLCGFDMKGAPWCSSASAIAWGYRRSSIPENVVITAAICRMKKTLPGESVERVRKVFEGYAGHYPFQRSAGCVFVNPPTGHGAGKLIDLAGCKGLSVGEAQVSDVHANFIVNNKEASEQDFIDLAIKVKRSVVEKSGIYLAPEVRFANPDSSRQLATTPKPLSVSVLKGGASRERGVSLESGGAVAKALRDAGYEVAEFDIDKPLLPSKAAKADVVFPVLHGGFGEDGSIQRVMEKKGVAFVGCGSEPSMVIIDKLKTKQLLVEQGISTAAYAVVTRSDLSFPRGLSLPVVVKPPLEGSTFGISIVKEASQWEKALEDAFACGTSEVLVERYIKGVEVTAGLLDGTPLPIVEIRYPGEMYDFDAKYTHQQGETMYLCPPETISLEKQEEIKRIAVKAYKAVGARHMLRVDMIVSDEDGIPYVLEMNSIPGFTSSSLLPKAAAAAGIPFIQLCGTLVQLAARRASTSRKK